MPRDDGDVAYLRDMLDECERIGRFVAGKSFEDYAVDELLRSGVERQIEIVGEAARRLSEAFRQQHPEVPWRPIIAQRHILAHEYGEIEHELIWRVACTHLPTLRAQLAVLVPPIA